MSKQEDTSSSQAQRPTTDNRDDWRTAPVIEPTRQKELKAYLANDVDIKEGKYPFKGIRLCRADVEWLLAPRENWLGPITRDDKSSPAREGLDLRGADLRGADLRKLPLARMRGGLSPEEWQNTTPQQRSWAAVHLDKASLEEVDLEGGILRWSYLAGANLYRAHLERTELHGAHLEGTNLYEAHLEGADLRRVFFGNTTVLEKAVLSNAEDSTAKLADVRWNSVNLAVVEWKQGKTRVEGRRENYLTLGDESRSLDPKEKRAGIRLHYFNAAIRANNQVSIALRAQGLNDEAAYYAYRAQILRLKALWWQVLKRAVDTPENESTKEGQQDKIQLGRGQRGQKLAAGIFSGFLWSFSGYGYRPQLCLYWYVAFVLGFAVLHYICGRGAIDGFTSLFMSIQAFHGRPFSSFSLEPSRSNPYLALDSIEAIFGLLIEALIVAIFTQRILGK